MTAVSDAMVRRATWAAFAQPPQVVGAVPLMPDSGPHALHGTIVNAAAPAYTFARNPKGQGYYGLDGADDRVELPVRFYDDAPDTPAGTTTGFTFVLHARHRNAVVNDVLFDCRNVAGNRGFYLQYSALTRLQIIGYQAAGVQYSATEATDTSYTSKTWCTVFAVDTASGAARIWTNGVYHVGTWAGAATRTTYDPAAVPTLGSVVGGGSNAELDVYGAAIFPWPFARTDAETIWRLCLDGVL